MPGEYSYFTGLASVLVREGNQEHPDWLVTWLPHDVLHPSYPGFTVTSGELAFPTDQGPAAVAEWVDQWAMRFAAERTPAEANDLEVPADDLEDVKRRTADAGWEFLVWREPDGRYSWSIDKEGTVLKSGVSATWDDAKLDSIIDFPAPSGEQ